MSHSARRRGATRPAAGIRKRRSLRSGKLKGRRVRSDLGTDPHEGRHVVAEADGAVASCSRGGGSLRDGAPAAGCRRLRWRRRQVAARSGRAFRRRSEGMASFGTSPPGPRQPPHRFDGLRSRAGFSAWRSNARGRRVCLAVVVRPARRGAPRPRRGASSSVRGHHRRQVAVVPFDFQTDQLFDRVELFMSSSG